MRRILTCAVVNIDNKSLIITCTVNICRINCDTNIGQKLSLSIVAGPVQAYYHVYENVFIVTCSLFVDMVISVSRGEVYCRIGYGEDYGNCIIDAVTNGIAFP